MPGPYIPPYFGYERVGNLIKIYKPGKELAGIVTSFEEYLAFIRTHTECAEERYRELQRPQKTLQSLNIKVDL